MSHTMTNEETRRTAHLSRLTLTEEEVTKHSQCLTKIMHLFDDLESIDTGDIYHLDLKSATDPTHLREDEVTEHNQREALAKFCPNFNEKTGHIVVPQVIEE